METTNAGPTGALDDAVLGGGAVAALLGDFEEVEDAAEAALGSGPVLPEPQPDNATSDASAAAHKRAPETVHAERIGDKGSKPPGKRAMTVQRALIMQECER